MTPNDKVVLIVARQEDQVNNPLDNLKDPAADLAALVNELKAEARAEQLRADDAEAYSKELALKLRDSEARRRFEYAPHDAGLIDAVRDLFPHELGRIFAYLLHFSGPYHDSGELRWKIERIRDAALEVARAADDEGVA